MAEVVCTEADASAADRDPLAGIGVISRMAALYEHAAGRTGLRIRYQRAEGVQVVNGADQCAVDRM